MGISGRVAQIVAVTCIAAAVVTARAQSAPPVPQSPASVSVERGRYLVTVQDCNGCHTPFKNGEPDMTKMLSGHPQDVRIGSPPSLAPGWSTVINETNTAWAGPWGVSFTTNLTPDQRTGIGMWTEEVFVASIRKGRHLGTGRALLPPMPWAMYAALTDDDLKSVFRYLQSIPPISNQVPQPVIAASAPR